MKRLVQAVARKDTLHFHGRHSRAIEVPTWLSIAQPSPTQLSLKKESRLLTVLVELSSVRKTAFKRVAHLRQYLGLS